MAEPLRTVAGRGLTVFCFHEVTDTPSSFVSRHGLGISPATFRRQIGWIRANFDIVGPDDLYRSLPKRAALLTFDDGFRGSFVNGIGYLAAERLPSVMFLNMETVAERRAMMSAVVCYLDEHVSAFAEFAASTGLGRPFHLTMTPKHLRQYEQRYGALNWDAMWEYQGELETMTGLAAWDRAGVVAFGNHLFRHWNAAALDTEELADEFIRNRESLRQLAHAVDFVAFPNGQPGTCFTDRDVATLRRLGTRRTFAASGRLNRDVDAFLLDRISLGPGDGDSNALWYRIARSLLVRPLTIGT